MNIRDDIIKALRKKYEADIAEAMATANIYLEKPVGIGEHPDIIKEVDKLIEKIAEAEDKIKIINLRFDDDIPF
jgi:methylaspartate ammonia-lyase|tara:strand:+ start:50 stop:271 length:222 start_codon:yes stop_codon:yes gene_type:complete